MRPGLMLAIAAMLAAVPVSAVPLYYTFDGKACDPGHDGCDGPQVRYVFRVDFDQEGYSTFTPTGGTLEIYPLHDHTGPVFAFDSFLAEYMGGDALPGGVPLGGGIAKHYSGQAHQRSGHPEYGYGSLLGSPDQAGTGYVYVLGRTLPSTWEEGQTGFEGRNYEHYADSDAERVSELTLTRISADIPPEAVPEPPAFVLAGTGLLGLALAVRRRR